LPEYRCDTVRHRGRVTLYLSGEIDLFAMADFLDAADAALATGPAAVIVDLADVAFMDSAGLSGLVQIQQQTRNAGASFHVQSPSRVVTRVIELSGLDALFGLTGPAPDDDPLA
jgi:anti-sigma B factor antagonist